MRRTNELESSTQRKEEGRETHEVSEASGNHELKSFGSTGGISSDHRVSSHDGGDGSVPRIERLGGDLRTRRKGQLDSKSTASPSAQNRELD